jgi:AcrR family transcriptional regulator
LPPLEFPPGTPRLEQILRTGCRLIYQYGYSGMTMRQLAGELDIKAASLYHHFPSKQDLLFRLMYDTATALVEGLLRIVDLEADPVEQLDAAIRWHILFHTRKHEEAFISHSEMRSLTPENLEAILRTRQHYELLFRDILNRCQRAGVIGRGDTSVVRNAVLTMCTATAGWFNPEGKLTAEQVADQMAAFARHGLLQPSAIASMNARSDSAHSASPNAADSAIVQPEILGEGDKKKVEWFRNTLYPAPPPQHTPDRILEPLRRLIKVKRRQLAPDQARERAREAPHEVAHEIGKPNKPR